MRMCGCVGLEEHLLKVHATFHSIPFAVNMEILFSQYLCSFC